MCRSFPLTSWSVKFVISTALPATVEQTSSPTLTRTNYLEACDPATTLEDPTALSPNANATYTLTGGQYHYNWSTKRPRGRRVPHLREPRGRYEALRGHLPDEVGAAEACRSAGQRPTLQPPPYLRDVATQQQRASQVRPGTPGACLHCAIAGHLQPRSRGHGRRDRRRDRRRR